VTTTISERLVNRISRRRSKEPDGSRRGFLAGAAVVGAAFAVNPWGYLVRPANAYDSVCGAAPNCADGYSVFCCTINGGQNSCPPDSFIGGWWKADNSSFCGGSARYYIDCNAFVGGPWKCTCASGTCDSRRIACNQFRYGQCNLSIPYEQTGPVVCRIVSCTPPWQQYDGICTSSSATDNSTASHSAPCIGVPPRGSFDSAIAVGTSIRVRGWAFDPDQPSTALKMNVRLDGGLVHSSATATPRPDVNSAFRITGTHGFDFTVPAKPGRHTVTVEAVNVAGGPGGALIGSRTVTVPVPPALPIGHVDSVTSTPGGHLRIKGWAFDRDQPSTSIQVALYLDGVGVRWFPTPVPRADVNRVYRITGNHGFDITVPASLGAHRVDVYGINVGGGSRNPLIGSLNGVVSGTLPVGVLDTVTGIKGAAVLSGWAYDPDQPSAAISVAVYRDGVGVRWFPTGVPRPDVNRAHGITGDHGFQITVPSAPGNHEYAVYAINVAPSGPNPLVGSRSLVVPA
jgi:hypothetical protein